MDDVSKYPNLFAALIEDGTWTDAQLSKLASLNLLRVFSRVERVRDALNFESERSQWIPLNELLRMDKYPQCASDTQYRLETAAAKIQPVIY